MYGEADIIFEDSNNNYLDDLKTGEKENTELDLELANDDCEETSIENEILLKNKNNLDITEDLLDKIEEEIIDDLGDAVEYENASEEINETDELTVTADESIDEEDEPEKKSYPSIDKILKETGNSLYFNEKEAEIFKETASQEVCNIIAEINSLGLKTKEKEVIEVYQRIHEMTLNFMENKEEILNSEKNMDFYKKFYLYKEVLQIKRKIYLDILAEENIKTVYYVVQKFRSTNLDYEDLVSSAMMGYAKALDRFSPVRGVKFATFAINCIYNDIRFHLRKENKVKANTVSISTKLSTDKNGNDLVMEDIIADGSLNPDEDLQQKDKEKTVRDAIRQNLTETERYILIYRYGFDRGIILTQKEIAKKLDMSQANISKIEKNSLDKMEEVLKGKEF